MFYENNQWYNFSSWGISFFVCIAFCSDVIVHRVYGDCLSQVTRIGIFFVLLVISVYFFFERRRFSYNIYYSLGFFLVWLVSVILALIYLRDIY